jgi:ribosomal 30S subunit maturation factor RimM
MGQPAPHVERMVPIGRVVKTHGLAGDILVYPYLPDLAFYRTMPRVLLYRDDGQSQSPAVRHASVVGERIRLHLEGYDSLTAVRGGELKDPEGEWRPGELSGAPVR